MTTIHVVQARMGSSRLPGKVAMDLHGRPILRVMLDRLLAGTIDTIVVATSTEPADDVVETIASAAGIETVRGSEADVLDRFGDVLQHHPHAETVVRLTADCPLIDPVVIDEARRALDVTGADYVSNTLERTFPDGLDVEVVRVEALRAAIEESTDRVEREHVTPFVYRRPERFAIGQVTAVEDAGDERWTLDTGADLEWLRSRLGEDTSLLDMGWQSILRGVGRRAERIGVHLRPTIGQQRVERGAYERSWEARVGDAPVGSVKIAVRDVGLASIDGHVDAGSIDSVAMLVDELVVADPQIVEIEGVRWTSPT